jgi:FAD/FMN-containing dehydrogenase
VEEVIVENLENIVGKSYVVIDRGRMESYLVDESAEPVRPIPAAELVLVKPANTQEVSEVLKIANENKIPVFPRGGGTGLVGGAIPTESGIILSMERMNKIEVDKENLMVVAEAGVTLEKLLSSAGDAGLFFPLHPGDEMHACTCMQKFVEAVKEHKPEILGMSALLTTTVGYFKTVIEALKEVGLRNKLYIMIGGPPHVTAEELGADIYCNDAFLGVKKALEYAETRRK